MPKDTFESIDFEKVSREGKVTENGNFEKKERESAISGQRGNGLPI